MLVDLVMFFYENKINEMKMKKKKKYKYVLAALFRKLFSLVIPNKFILSF